MNRDMLSRRLQRRGYEVSVAVDGGEGLALALAAPLQSLLRAGKEAVALIERYLTPGTATPAEALGPLAEAMREPLAAIEAKIGEIRSLDDAPPAGDVNKIEAAVLHLRSQLS